ncbi:MAG: hypothetical protein RRY79_00390 [Clostridia bacterium]
MEKCILNPEKVCDNCGDCRCDLDKNKICDNCEKCLNLNDREFLEMTLGGMMIYEEGDLPTYDPALHDLDDDGEAEKWLREHGETCEKETIVIARRKRRK